MVAPADKAPAVKALTVSYQCSPHTAACMTDLGCHEFLVSVVKPLF